MGLRPQPFKRFVHSDVGRLKLKLTCQTLLDPEEARNLLVYTAEPGSESADRLEMLGVLGGQPRVRGDDRPGVLVSVREAPF